MRTRSFLRLRVTLFRSAGVPPASYERNSRQLRYSAADLNRANSRSAGVPAGSFEQTRANGNGCARTKKNQSIAIYFCLAPSTISALTGFRARRSRRGRQRYKSETTAFICIALRPWFWPWPLFRSSDAGGDAGATRGETYIS
jgi:hypothetical protein